MVSGSPDELIDNARMFKIRRRRDHAGLKLVLIALAMVAIPWSAYAQATLAGLAKDTSGGVLPGVTVEASSPVLIEKVRTTTTDAAGRYQLVDLRPGTTR